MEYKLKLNDKAQIIKNGNKNFLKHFLNLGSSVYIISKHNGYSEPAYYVKTECGKKYSEPILETELKKLKK